MGFNINDFNESNAADIFELNAQEPLEFFEAVFQGKEFRPISVSAEAFANAPTEKRELMMARDRDALYISEVVRDKLPMDALKEWSGERRIYALSSEQFTVFHAKISEIAFRSLIKPEKEFDKSLDATADVRNWEKLPVTHQNEKLTKELLSKISRTISKELNGITKNSGEEFREDKDREAAIEKELKVKLTQIKSSEENRGRRKEDWKSQDNSGDLTKEKQGVKATPIKEIVFSMSEDEKHVKENLGGPNPNA